MFDNSELAVLFPGGLSQATARTREALAMEYLTALHQLPSRERDEKCASIKARFPHTRGASHADATGVIRFDLCLPGAQPAEAPRQLWLDHAIVHETSDSYRAAVLTHLRAGGKPCLSLPFKRAENEKRGRFRGVIRVAERLAREGYLGFHPFFLFPVVSSLGSVNSYMTKMLKWIGDRYKTRLHSLPEREDGVSKSALLARFRGYLKRAVCFAVLRATALGIHSQGRTDVRRP